MDEQPVQLIHETRVPIPPTKEHPERVDYEYERTGMASIFMFSEPLSGWRQVTVRPRRTKNDWAQKWRTCSIGAMPRPRKDHWSATT